MNFAEIDEDDQAEQKILMMDTYSRLLRLRTLLEGDHFQPKEVPEFTALVKLKEEYLELVQDILVGYEKLQPKKERAETLLQFVDKLGGHDIKYAQQLKAIIDDFDTTERLTESAAELKEKIERMLGLRRVFELCTECDVSSRYICFVCLDRTVEMFVDPCGHVICEPCSGHTRGLCPFCRSTVHRFQKMFI